MNPLRNLRPQDCTPKVFHAACSALGFGGSFSEAEFLRRLRVDGHEVWVWNPDFSRGNRAGYFAAGVCVGGEVPLPKTFDTLGPAIDYALSLVAERTQKPKPEPYPGYEDLPASMSAERRAIATALQNNPRGDVRALLENYGRLLDRSVTILGRNLRPAVRDIYPDADR